MTTMQARRRDRDPVPYGQGDHYGTPAADDSQGAHPEPGGRRLRRGWDRRRDRRGPTGVCPGGDWPTYRHDAALSAVSPLKGGLGQPPRVAWSVDLGGPRVPSETVLVRDVTGDGRDEILILGDDAVECRDAQGRRLWRLEGYPKPVGRRRPRLCRRRVARAPALDDASAAGSRPSWSTGARGGRSSLWKDENNFGGHTRFGKLLARRRRGAGRQHLQRADPAGAARREASGSSASRTASIDPTSASASPCPATSTRRSCSSTTSTPTAPWRWS